MYTTGLELIKLCHEKGQKVCEVVLETESEVTEVSSLTILSKMQVILEVMKAASSKAVDQPAQSVSGLSGGDAKKMQEYRTYHKTYSGNLLSSAVVRALSSSEVNACMGRIVAAPTAGSCGILPAAIISACEYYGGEDQDMIQGLLTASGIGRIISFNATVSGADGGCQAECGSAAAMAAGALVEMRGGSPEAVFNAAAMSLKNILGLVCDPVAGLVEVPCAKRNALGVANAMISADMALAGIESKIPFDEVVTAMYQIGKALPASLKETALGGLAATPTGIRLANEIFGK